MVIGFLITLGYLNPLAVYGIVVLGDMIGDSFLYALGRFGGRRLVSKFGHKIGVTEEKMVRAKEYFHRHHKKALVFSKVIHGIGMAGIIAAGSLRVKYIRFVVICGIVSFVQSAVFLVIGLAFGRAYDQIGQYLNYYAAAGSVLVLVTVSIIAYRKIKISLD